MRVLGIILARAGSKGLPGKNVAILNGRPMVAWTIDHALASECLSHVVVTTDGSAIADAARKASCDIGVIERPDELASDTATVDAAARHAVETVEKRTGEIFDAVVILYGNVPLRPVDLIDDAVAKLQATGCDSVQSVCPVGKMHPYWMKTLGDAGELEHYQPNNVYRRQDLPPVYMLDGGIIAVTRKSLMTVEADEPHAFLGQDRCAVVTQFGEVVDIDEPKDLLVAEAAMKTAGNNVDGEGTLYTSRSRQPFDLVGQSGDDEGVYIIAELGVNHDGSVEQALCMTRAACDAGANAVKLQLFDAKMLLSAQAGLAAYQENTADDPFELLAKLQLGVEQMLKVKALAHELGMGFIVTPFSCELFPDMQVLDPDAVKIAGPDCVNTPLIEAMLTLGKPMLISTGTATIDEVIQFRELWWRVRRLVFLHCVSSYPTPVAEADLQMISRWALCADHGGYSDHTTSIHTGGLAVAAGARVLEKHFTHDRGATGPDHKASLDPIQFKQYVDFARMAEMMLGETRAGQSRDVDNIQNDIQSDVRNVSRQSLCAVHDLAVGDVLMREDLTIKRPGTGIPAALFEQTIGSTLRNPVKANHLLHEGDV